MKLSLAIFTGSLVMLSVASADAKDFYVYEQDAVNYVQSEFSLLNALFGLDKRKPKASHYDEFVYGFSDSAFKIQPRLATTCFSDGAQYWKGTKDMIINLIETMSIDS